MARRGFEARWTEIVPWHLERSTCVLASTAAIVLLTWAWRPIPEVVWSVGNPVGEAVLWGLFALGWAIVLLSTFLINH